MANPAENLKLDPGNVGPQRQKLLGDGKEKDENPKKERDCSKDEPELETSMTLSAATWFSSLAKIFAKTAGQVTMQVIAPAEPMVRMLTTYAMSE